MRLNRMLFGGAAIVAAVVLTTVSSSVSHAGEQGSVNGSKCVLPGVDRHGNLNLLLGGIGRSYKKVENGKFVYTCSAKVKNLSGESYSDTIRFRFGRKKLFGRLYISRPRRGYKAYARLVFSVGKSGKQQPD